MKIIILLLILTSCATEEVAVKQPENLTTHMSSPQPKKLNINKSQSFELKTKLEGPLDLVNECNQLLNIYCMKDNRSKKFANENSCLSHVNITLLKCEKNKTKMTKQTINCLKKNLQIK